MHEKNNKLHNINSAYKFMHYICGGNENIKQQYGFVMTPFNFNSDNLRRMKLHIAERGLPYFTFLIKIVPFEMQWYGEYVQRNEKFIPTNGIFTLIGNPKECHNENGDSDDSYGICFQSIIYNEGERLNENLIYKRPKNCS